MTQYIKRFAMAVAAVVVAISANAEYIDVVKLKNGNTIKGTIEEQVINKSVKIRTSDDSVFVLSMTDIESISKEEVASTPADDYGMQQYQNAAANNYYTQQPQTPAPNYNDTQYQVNTNYPTQGYQYEQSPLTTQVPEETPTDEHDEFCTGYVEFFYSASNSDYPKESGSYGLAASTFPVKLGGHVRFGGHFQLAGINAGLVPTDYLCDTIKVGPSFAFYLNKYLMISTPFTIDFNVANNYYTSFTFAPSLYIGHNTAFCIGPQYVTSAYGSSLGFRLALCL